tara:strand:- start:8784 stop:9929 length:1146 start_codon:yes stop_codon:yes gene_type:complete
MDDFIIFGKPVINDDEINEVLDSLKSGWLGTGPKAKLFEENFSKYKGVINSIALNSATAGLHLSCSALNLNPGDEVITTAMTFCATVNTIIHAGAKPVLVDIDPLTWNIDPEQIESKINKNTKAIVPVHFAGRPCKMDQIMDIAENYDLYVIEDCAHAIETEFKGKKAGTIGDYGVFSFYATKNLAVGEGGMVIGKDKEKMSRIKTLALHGMSKDAWNRFSDDGYKHYKVIEAGYKYNMPDITAAIGIHQLKKVEKFSIQREKIWNLYNNEFKDLPIELPATVEPNTRHAYHLYNICIDKNKCNVDRDSFLNLMNNNKIGVGVHYESIPTHPFYMKKFGWNPLDFPNSNKFGSQTASIPLSPYLSDNNLDKIISVVKKIVN